MTITKTVDRNPPSATDQARQTKRAERYRLRRGSWLLSKSRTLRGCGRGLRDGTVGVHLVPGEDGPRGTATGLVSCSSVWACPVCSAHIRQVRANDIDAACERHLNSGGGVLFLTLTLRHRDGQSLGWLMDGLLDGWRRTIRGNPWKRKRDRYGVLGQIRAVEVTHGENGWHPHLHLLLFTSKPMTADEVEDFEGWIHGRWAKFIMDHGLGKPSREHGVRLQVVRTSGEVARYIAKVQDVFGKSRGVGLEIARGDLKRGRRGGSLTPFELLDAAIDGEKWAVELWWEYERATKGRRAIEWSRGLRDALGLADEQTDEAITDETLTDDETLVATLSKRDWVAVCRAGLDAAILEAVEWRGLDGVLDVVRLAYERTAGSRTSSR